MNRSLYAIKIFVHENGLSGPLPNLLRLRVWLLKLYNFNWSPLPNTGLTFFPFCHSTRPGKSADHGSWLLSSLCCLIRLPFRNFVFVIKISNNVEGLFTYDCNVLLELVKPTLYLNVLSLQWHVRIGLRVV